MRIIPLRAWLALFLGLTVSLLPSTHAVFIPFQNCLPVAITTSNPPQLQFTPLFFNAKFDTANPAHPLSLTVYGNVSGQQFLGPYPPPDSPKWSDPNSTLGKITNVGTQDKFSTLTALYEVLTYSAFDDRGEEFCPTLTHGSCPLGPAFGKNASDPNELPSFALSHKFGSTYAFSTIVPTIQVISGDKGGPTIVCVTASVTPDLGPHISAVLTWLPAAILILKGIATLSAAIWSPWGSSDIFRWSSNYGRDEDLLRLVTPGFGDCLQYIQFIVLTGSLSLRYPGFFQPAVSQSSWSLLLFNESFVSHGPGSQSLVDGVYSANATYGLTQMSQLIGMSEAQDVWACMAIFLLGIAGVVILLCQLGSFGRWIYRHTTRTREQDLRKKNLPFTLGNLIRLLFNFFILPIVAISLFQLVIALHSPISVVACAAVLLAIMIISAGFILRVIFATKPRTLLFDDMPIVLLYGPLYNTYSDSAAPFALIPVFITFVRGVAIGAVQPSGIAQVIVLAICEVILILTLNSFRPFQGQTSMNLYHTFFAAVRLITILLMISFVPSLGLTEASKGWIGYVILLLHACVLIFGFFLNSAQTVVEVAARAMGAGDDAQSRAIRGSILNWRMLKKRQTRPDAGDRASMTSSAAILRDQETPNFGGRSRSISASSHMLLNRTSGYENFSNTGEPVGSPDQDIENSVGFGATGGGSNGKPSLSSKIDSENFYRPPRPRAGTLDAVNNPGTRTRKSGGDFPYQDNPGAPVGHTRDSSYESGGLAGHDSPAPAYIRERHGSNDSTAPRTDYAVREVDQYYRGPALNDQPTRKLKTGPADPEGPASTAQGWFQRLMFGVRGGKKKDQVKGFEVVRSSRLPPGLQPGDGNAEAVEMQTSPPMNQEPYTDTPSAKPSGAELPANFDRSISPIEDDGDDDFAQAPTLKTFDFGFDGNNDNAQHQPSRLRPDSETVAIPGLAPNNAAQRASAERKPSQSSIDSRSNYNRQSSVYPDDDPNALRPPGAPYLDPLDLGSDLDLPSRFNSTVSGHSSLTRGRGGVNDGQNWLRAVDALEWNHSNQQGARQQPSIGALSYSSSHQSSQYPLPSIPRRSSRRESSQDPPTARYQPSGDAIFEGFGASQPDLLGPTQGEDRPSSVDNVHRHRAADSITRNSLGANVAGQASSAEYFGQSPP